MLFRYSVILVPFKERLSFLSWITLDICWKSTDWYIHWSVSWTLSFHWFICPPLWPYYAGLNTLAWFWNYLVEPSNFFLLFQNYLSYSRLLSHVNFRIHFSLSTKKPSGVLVEITLNLWTACWKSRSLTMLSLPIYEHCLSSLLVMLSDVLWLQDTKCSY